ncbi:MAG: phosphoglucosamine mutase [Candidatus Latescibacterota bacterium]|nr:phosphoglucosamine mutase [Candidatus Latescibacterota bacterium]
MSVSGIRGIVDQSLTAETVARFARAFASEKTSGARVILARDTRPSGERFSRIASEALQVSGCTVIDLGICPTPAAKLMVLEDGAQGGLIITASHNSIEWNGLKLVREDGIFLDAEASARVERAYHDDRSREEASVNVESIEWSQTRSIYLKRVLAAVDTEAIRAAGLRAAVDPCNGTGALYCRELLDALNVEAIVINDEPNGDFAHEPEPISANLQQLGEAVRNGRCQVGFAIDPDADRVALVAEDGEPVGEDYTLALAVQSVTQRQRGPVVTTLSTSQIVSDVAAAAECPVLLTPVGEVFVVDTMITEGAVVGGEGNGGVILTSVDPGRDAAVGMAMVLDVLAMQRTSLSRLVARLPRYAIDKRKVGCQHEDFERAVEEMVARYPSALRHPVVDGVKLYLTGSLECPWIHLRASNTEPIVRVIAESASPQEATKLCDEAEELLRG